MSNVYGLDQIVLAENYAIFISQPFFHQGQSTQNMTLCFKGDLVLTRRFNAETLQIELRDFKTAVDKIMLPLISEPVAILPPGPLTNPRP